MGEGMQIETWRPVALLESRVRTSSDCDGPGQHQGSKGTATLFVRLSNEEIL